MSSLYRPGPERKPRFIRSLPVTVGWWRDADTVLYYCAWSCRCLHVSIGGFGHCPRARNREFVTADLGPAPPAIRDADRSGRLTRAARDEILIAFEKLDVEIAKDSPPAPTLPAYRYSRGTRVRLIVYCKFCRDWHVHGARSKFGAADGHRVAHCHEDFSPYRKSGYCLKEVGFATEEIKRDLRRKRARGVVASQEVAK